MTNPIPLIVPMLLLSLACSIAGAQTRLGLEDAVALALEKNPFLSANAERIGSAAGLKQQAGMKPNPRLYFQQENIRAWERPGLNYLRETDTFAYIGQTVERSGKRESRVEHAAANEARLAADQALLRRQLAARVGSAYWTAAGTHRFVLLLTEEQQNFSQVVKYTESRVKEGAAAGVDLLRLQLEAQRVDALLAGAHQDAERSRIGLYREIGLEAPESVEFTDELDKLREVVAVDIASILERRPEVVLAQNGVEQAEANLKMQRASAKADPDFVVGYKRSGGFDTVLAGVQINLPVRNKNEGLIAAAEAELRGARLMVRAVKAQVAAELQAATSDYTLKRKLVSGELPGMVQRSKESSRITEFAFREGGVDMLRLLDAEKTRIETQLLYWRALADFQQSAVALAVATGLNP